MENTNLTKIKNIQFVFQIVFLLFDNTVIFKMIRLTLVTYLFTNEFNN